MIQKGLLDKHGKPNGNTPANWKEGYVDYRYTLFSLVPPVGTPMLTECVACISSRSIGTLHFETVSVGKVDHFTQTVIPF